MLVVKTTSNVIIYFYKNQGDVLVDMGKVRRTAIISLLFLIVVVVVCLCCLCLPLVLNVSELIVSNYTTRCNISALQPFVCGIVPVQGEEGLRDGPFKPDLLSSSELLRIDSQHRLKLLKGAQTEAVSEIRASSQPFRRPPSPPQLCFILRSIKRNVAAEDL